MRRRLRRLLGRQRVAAEPTTRTPPDVVATANPADREIVERAQPFSMTPGVRLLANIDATDYLVDRDVPGALVECGVWRGGSVLSMLLTLQRRGITDRDVYLYDTFEGMTEPTELDRSPFGEPATHIWERAAEAGERPWSWLFGAESFGLDQVQELLGSTGYPAERIHYVPGRVEDTIPETMPDKIALLRLDTDWYESTRHEMRHLFPRLQSGGVLIVDDYGHWTGARRAVDEHLREEGISLLLHRIDYSARIAVR